MCHKIARHRRSVPQLGDAYVNLKRVCATATQAALFHLMCCPFCSFSLYNTSACCLLLVSYLLRISHRNKAAVEQSIIQ